MQKFQKYDHVMIAKDLGGAMSHFASDTDAIVMYSYNDKYGGGDTKSYSLYVNGKGESSWYEEWQLTLIDRNGKHLLKEWEDAAKVKAERESDLDWIFENGKDVLSRASGATISTLARCLGIRDLWGSQGEGYTYYANAMATLALAEPFLRNNDKIGWLKYSEGNKVNR